MELEALGGAFHLDLVARAGDVLLLAEVLDRLSVDDVARAFMFSHLIQQEELISGRFEYILVAKVVPPGVREMAPKVGVTVLRIANELRLPGSIRRGGPVVSKLSNEKSWRVVASLLRFGPTSIREISLRTEVSYGWAYATISRMEQMGLATRTRDGVAVTDMEKLLNGLAWERPLKGLWLDRDQKIAGNDVLEAGRILSEHLSENGIAHAFTGPTAGGLYSGYAHRFDRLYVYLDHEDPDLAIGPLEDPFGTISVTVLRADRDVFSKSQAQNGLLLASEAQTLLDLAGMGASAWDLTLEVARHYASAGGG
ncbi:MAG: hypothetical protein GQ558_07775 [Thermoplasmata archaeon]|nr:hypothetical protein [Thermoplasmata archaeon]